MSIFKNKNFNFSNFGPQHPAAHGVLWAVIFTKKEAIKNITKRNFSSIISKSEVNNNNPKYSSEHEDNLFLLLFFCLLSFIIIFIILFTNFFQFSYYLIYKNNILIHYPVFFLSVICYFFIIIEFNNTRLWLLTVIVAFFIFLAQLIPEIVCFVQLTENFSLVRIPTFEQFELLTENCFNNIIKQSKLDRNIYTYDKYRHISKEIYKTLFNKGINFNDGKYSFNNNIENIKDWHNVYVNRLKLEQGFAEIKNFDKFLWMLED